ncbi:unnamed protein product [Rotaria sordida]|uniref:G-protein coupled receptors family 1 profile domain-containing protein n=4 Tax=Rotaria sordida TaxID=392033 RepID=A0A819RG36_9BILA|nr:unnamed protein product [Rotaria sordida]
MSSLSNTLNLAQKMLVQYCHTTIFILGTIGSLINICLFSRRNLRSNSCCIYLLSSSINGLILLSIGIIPQIYNLYRSPNPFTTILSFCKARSYLNQTSAMSCRWLLVMACIDRCFSCSTSVRIRNLSSVNTARIIVIIINIIWFILPIHMIIYANIQPPGNIACSITNNNVDIYHRFYTIIMGGALPSLIAFISSLFIWKNFQERTKRRIIIPNNEVDRRKKLRDQQVIFMLLIQVAIFIISTIPFMSFNIYSTMTQYITDKSADRKAIEGFLKTLTELLIYFIAMSFYSNTLVSKTFRKELIKLFEYIIICGRQKNRLRINPLDISTTKTVAFPMTITRKVLLSMPQAFETSIKI